MNTAKALWTMLVASAVATAACGESKSSFNPVAPSAAVAEATQNQDAGDGVFSPTAGPKNGNGNGGGSNGGGKGNNGGGNGNSGGGNGNANDGGNGNGRPPEVPPRQQTPSNTTPTNTTPTTTRKVEIQGPISAASGDSVTVRGQVVTVPSTCTIRHGNRFFEFGDLKVGDLVHIKGQRTTTGTGATAGHDDRVQSNPVTEFRIRRRRRRRR